MAEAIGVVGSVISIVDLCSKILTHIRQTKDGKSEQQNLLNEVKSVKIFLVKFSEDIEDNAHLQDSHSKTVKLLLSSEGPLKRLELLLRGLLLKLTPEEGWKKYRSALTWPLEHSQVKDALFTIERCKSWISLALQNDHT